MAKVKPDAGDNPKTAKAAMAPLSSAPTLAGIHPAASFTALVQTSMASIVSM
jgi:hypothetical protein